MTEGFSTDNWFSRNRTKSESWTWNSLFCRHKLTSQSLSIHGIAATCVWRLNFHSSLLRDFTTQPLSRLLIIIAHPKLPPLHVLSFSLTFALPFLSNFVEVVHSAKRAHEWIFIRKKKVSFSFSHCSLNRKLRCSFWLRDSSSSPSTIQLLLLLSLLITTWGSSSCLLVHFHYYSHLCSTTSAILTSTTIVTLGCRLPLTTTMTTTEGERERESDRWLLYIWNSKFSTKGADRKVSTTLLRPSLFNFFAEGKAEMWNRKWFKNIFQTILLTSHCCCALISTNPYSLAPFVWTNLTVKSNLCICIITVSCACCSTTFWTCLPGCWNKPSSDEQPSLI